MTRYLMCAIPPWSLYKILLLSRLLSNTPEAAELRGGDMAMTSTNQRLTYV